MDVAPRRVKRKRNAGDDVGSIIGRKLHHELKEVHKASKKAKLFEVRKMIKRLRSPRPKGTNTSEQEDLEAQLLVLKHLDVDMVGNTAFKTKICKIKQLYANEHVKAAIEEEIGSNMLALAQLGTPTHKAQSRLLSSKSLAEHVTRAVQTMHLLVCPQDEGKTVEEREAPLNAVHRDSDLKGDEKLLRAATELENDNASGIDEEWESGSVGDADAALSTDEDTHGNQANAATNLSGARSTFLPSLAVGFVPGDSDDSDWEAETKMADVERRKNRRGQRARRAIWEKKYGRNANHKKKELEQQTFSDVKQKFRKHTDSNRQNNKHERQKRSNSKVGIPRDPAESPTSRKNEQPLHPSWEAKKRLKEQMNPHIVPSQGKKIVF